MARKKTKKSKKNAIVKKKHSTKILKNPEIPLSNADKSCIITIIKKIHKKILAQMDKEMQIETKKHLDIIKKLTESIDKWSADSTKYMKQHKTLKLSRDLSKQKTSLNREYSIESENLKILDNITKQLKEYKDTFDASNLPEELRLYVTGYISATLSSLAMQEINTGKFSGMEIDMFLNKHYRITALNAYTVRGDKMKKKLSLFKKED